MSFIIQNKHILTTECHILPSDGPWLKRKVEKHPIYVWRCEGTRESLNLCWVHINWCNSLEHDLATPTKFSMENILWIKHCLCKKHILYTLSKNYAMVDLEGCSFEYCFNGEKTKNKKKPSWEKTEIPINQELLSIRLQQFKKVLHVFKILLPVSIFIAHFGWSVRVDVGEAQDTWLGKRKVQG